MFISNPKVDYREYYDKDFISTFCVNHAEDFET